MRLFTLSALTALMLASPVAMAAETAPRTITVTGEGKISIAPDMATIVIGVQAEAEVAAEALDTASAATAAILATLDGEDIDRSDVQSGAIRLTPRYSSSVLSSGQQIVGYRAVNSVEVRVLDLDRLGGLLAAVVGDGANRLDGVRFGLQDPSVATNDARVLAVQDGIARADLYAGAAGVSVGALVSLSELGSGGYRPVMAEPVVMEMAASSPQFDVPVEAGQIDLSAQVMMVFEIASQDD